MRIRSQLLAYFALLTLVPLMLVAWFALSALRSSQARHEDASLQERAIEMGGHIDAYIDSMLEGLRSDSRLPVLTEYLTAGPAQRVSLNHPLNALLRNVVSKDMVHAGSAALLDAGGRNLVDTELSNVGAQEEDSLWVRQARYSGLASFVGPLISEQGNALLYATQPVRDSAGKIVGYLRVIYSAARLQQIVRGKAQHVSVFGLLLDSDGVVIAHGLKPGLQGRALLGGDAALIERLRSESRLARTGTPERLSASLPAISSGLSWIHWLHAADERPDRVAIVPVRGMLWRLALVAPAAEYHATSAAAVRGVLLLGGLMVLLVLAAAWLAARQIAAPIVALTEAADAMVKPDGNALALPLQARGEIGRLARALQGMTGRLQDALREQQLHIEALRQTEARLRSSEARFSGLFHLSPVPFLLSRLGSREVVDLNGMCELVFGLKRTSVIGRTMDALGLALYEDELAAAQDALDRGKDVDRVMSMGTAHGGGRFRVFARAFQVAEANWAVWTFVDVTETEHSRRALEDLNATLEQRVGERTEELAQALERLQMAQEELVRSEKLAALASLVAGVAHELNTPVGNSVIVASTLHDMSLNLEQELAADKVRRSVLDTYVKNVREAADMLGRNLERAHALVASFKQVSVDQVSEQRRSFDLAETLQEVVATLAPILRNSPWKLRLEIEPGLRMDSYPGALGQVVTNFVTNAVAHAFEGRHSGHVLIHAGALGEHEIELVCSDDGIGIPAEYIKRVFDPFFTTKLGRGGSGLGLHIVYNLVTSTLGGRIDVASEQGRGTRFRIVLPSVAPQIAVAPFDSGP